ncbi:MAG: type II secretion system F family protein, partial [Candidatus Omnitrophota bacterium]
MSKYLITAKDSSGRVFNEVIESLDEGQAIRQAQVKGLFVTAVKHFADKDRSMATVSAVAKARSFTHNSIKLDDVIAFARQVSTMLSAGVLLLRSLRIISAQLESRDLTRVIEEVASNVEQGHTFSGSIAKYPKVFSPFWVSLIEVGEASGTMPKVLEKLTSYMEDSAKFRSSIVGALIYPMVLAFICIAAVAFFVRFVGLTFERIFAD